MDKKDRQIYKERYGSFLKQYGYSPEALGWGKKGRQEVRFSILARHILRHLDASVLDVGCGFADLYRYLKKYHWNGKYTGLDIVDELLNVAREIDPALDLRNEDIAEAEDLGKYDFVVASGIFNAKLMYEDNERHISNTLSRMFDHAGIAAIADFMSTYVDYQKEGAWHSDPANVIGYARKLSRRFILYYDYMPYEFAMVIFKDDLVSNENVFNALIST
jgi:SAM-dependent methyltransferase